MNALRRHVALVLATATLSASAQDIVWERDAALFTTVRTRGVKLVVDGTGDLTAAVHGDVPAYAGVTRFAPDGSPRGVVSVPFVERPAEGFYEVRLITELAGAQQGVFVLGESGGCSLHGCSFDLRLYYQPSVATQAPWSDPLNASCRPWTALAAAPDGGVYTAGTTCATHIDPARRALVHFAASGAIARYRYIVDLPVTATIERVAAHPAGGVIVTGMTATSANAGRPFVARVLSEGNVAWLGYASMETRPDRGFDRVVVAADGTTYVAGRTGVATAPVGIVAAFDTSGVLRWERTSELMFAGTAGFDALGIDAAGRAYVAGGASDGTTSVALVAVFDAQGNLAWSDAYRHAAYPHANATTLAVDASGHVTVGGAASAVPGGANEALLVRYGPRGSRLWTRLLSHREIVNDVVATPDAAYALASRSGGAPAPARLVRLALGSAEPPAPPPMAIVGADLGVVPPVLRASFTGSPAPTGWVAFLVDGAPVCPAARIESVTPSTSEAACVPPNGLAAGVHTLSLIYAGDAQHGPVTLSRQIVVGADTSSVAVPALAPTALVILSTLLAAAGVGSMRGGRRRRR